MIKDNFYWVDTPEGACPVYTLFPSPSCPAVLFCHDYKGSSHEWKRFFWKLSRRLYDKGIGSIRFDYNGFGNSTSEAVDFSIESGVSDTIAVFKHVAGLEEVDMEKLAILGLGLGGRIAAYLLGNSEDLKAGILLNPADTHFKSEEELEELQFSFEGETTWDEGWEFSKKFFEFDNFGEGSAEIKGTETPVLIISGFDDEFIFHKTSEKYAQAVPTATLEELMDADHFFSAPEAGTEVERLITNFVGKILLGLEEEPSDGASEPLEKIEVSTAPPLAGAIENADTVKSDTVDGSEVVIKEKLPPGAEAKEKTEEESKEKKTDSDSESEDVKKEETPPDKDLQEKEEQEEK